MVHWRGLKKSKNGSKNSFLLYFWPKIAFSFGLPYSRSDTDEMEQIDWETKKLGPFFSQNRLFWLKFGDFVKKSKKCSKNCVFANFRLKFGFFFSRVYFQSVAAYIKFIAPKTKKLQRFSGKNDPPRPKTTRWGGVPFFKNRPNFFVYEICKNAPRDNRCWPHW